MTREEFYDRRRVLKENYRRSLQELIKQYTKSEKSIGDKINDSTIKDIDVFHVNFQPVCVYFCEDNKGQSETFLQSEL